MIKLTALAILLLVGTAYSQGTPLRLDLSVGAQSTEFDENRARFSGPELTGNSFSVPVRLEAQYSLQPEVRLPLWIDVAAQLPVITSSGDEVGKSTNNGIEYTVQKEQAAHRRTNVSTSLGFVVLPFLQPYLVFEQSRLATRRTGQQNGQDDGSFLPDPNQDYTETLAATYLGAGAMSVIPLEANNGSRLRLNIAYLNAQSAAVTNTYFDDGTWGQHATGYQLAGRLAFETVLGALASNSYLSVGGDASYHHWNGDGRIGTELFEQPSWPANSVTELGAFIGIGLFF